MVVLMRLQEEWILMINLTGKTVFLTREEAEKKLEEMKK